MKNPFRKKNTFKPVTVKENLIEALNFVPPDYVNSPIFETAMNDPLRYTTSRLRGIDKSAITDDSHVICKILDDYIEAVCEYNKNYGNRQFIYNTGSILRIFDSINEDVFEAENRLELCNRDLDRINAEIAKYEQLQKNIDNLNRRR